MRNSIGFALLITLATTGTAAASGWNWSFTPYVWATDVGADLTRRES